MTEDLETTSPEEFDLRSLPPKLQVGLSPDGNAAISITAVEENGEVTTRSVILTVAETGETALHLLAIYNMHVANGYAAALRSHQESQSRLAIPPTSDLWTPNS